MSQEEIKELLIILSRSPEKYVVKPQKEGGGHNYYDKEILDLLPKNFDNLEEELNPILRNSIVMERIFPPEIESKIIFENKLKKVKCVSEFSIYGIILSNAENNHFINKSSGFLVRTKETGCNEGGVAAGYSAIDLPYLVDGSLNEEREIEFN